MIYLNNLNLNKNELQNAVIQPLAVAPADPRLGQIYTDSTDGKIKQYNGSEWNTIGVVVEASETNGNILVDGVELTVYELPTATTTTIGGIKIGTGFKINAEGALIRDIAYYTGIRGESETDNAVFTRVLAGVVPNEGDVFIIKTLIHSGKYEFASFVYDAGNWCAMDGNYNAENVYFSENIPVTTAPSSYISLTNGQGTIPAAGKNLKGVIQSIWTKEDLTLTISQPSASLSAAGSVTQEVGTTYALPSASVTLSDGNYEYGSKDADGNVYTKANGAGVLFGDVIIKYGDTVVAQQTGKNSKLTGSLTNDILPESSRIVTDDKITHSFTATAAYPVSTRYPVTNLGNFLKDITTGNGTITGTATDDISLAKGNIAAKATYSLSTKNATATITGYRPFFYGKLYDNDPLTSEKIRGLTNGGQYNASKTLTIKSDGETNIVKFIVAIPASSDRSGVTHVDSTAGMTVDETKSYKLTENAVNVADARELADDEGNPVNAAAYDVYVFQPAAIDAGAVHEITLG